jgi:hypothetical protein
MGYAENPLLITVISPLRRNQESINLKTPKGATP